MLPLRVEFFQNEFHRTSVDYSIGWNCGKPPTMIVSTEMGEIPPQLIVVVADNSNVWFLPQKGLFQKQPIKTKEWKQTINLSQYKRIKKHLDWNSKVQVSQSSPLAVAEISVAVQQDLTSMLDHGGGSTAHVVGAVGRCHGDSVGQLQNVALKRTV